jgi:hypothetical protein
MSVLVLNQWVDSDMGTDQTDIEKKTTTTTTTTTTKN